MRPYFRSPTFLRTNVTANANPVLRSGTSRLSCLQLLPGILIDVLGCLPRSDVDACQLVCRAFRQTIDERARDLPVYEVDVLLKDRPPLVQYLAVALGRGGVGGFFFHGLRDKDRPYFRNTALTVRTTPGSVLHLLPAEILEYFLQGLSLDKINLRIVRLTCPANATEASGIFQLARTYNIASLDLSYSNRRKQRATDFIAAVFKEARSTRLSKLVVSIEDVGALKCVEVDAVGRRLIDGILAHGQTSVAEEFLVLTLPYLGSYPLISLLIEALSRDSSLRSEMRVALKFPSSVSLAELWPHHTDYLYVERELWAVLHDHGLIAVGPTSFKDTTTYMLTTKRWSQ